MKFNKKISPKYFIYSQIVILILGLLFLGGLYYILNIQYQRSNNPFVNGPVTSAPKTLKLDLDYPDEESLVFTSSILISGQTAPFKDVLVYTDSQDQVVKSKPDGRFSLNLKMDEGENKITVAVFDTNGESKSVDRTVYYSKEKI